MTSLPPVLSIAGSDCSAGAGLQADLKTISALGGYGLTAVTSVVSETPHEVSMIQSLPPALISDQIRLLMKAFPVAAVKVGMIGGPEQVEAVVRSLDSKDPGPPLVVDPVMVATSGGRLLEDEAVAQLKQQLLPLARLVTPNLDEARVLAGQEIQHRADMEACARRLAEELGTAVLLKGGHLVDDAAADLLVHDAGEDWFETERVHGVHTHGTGCCYSAAVATGLAKGLALPEAVSEAKEFVHAAILRHLRWQSGSPAVDALNHFHSVR